MHLGVDAVGNKLIDAEALDEAVTRAQADVDQLQTLGLPAERICIMLRRRHSTAVLQRIFPNVQLSDDEPPLKRVIGAEAALPSASPAASVVPPSTATDSSRTAPPTPDRAVTQEARELAFQYVPLIQCTFPHSEQVGVNSYTRRNGRLELTVATSREGVGLPYGVPARLLSIFSATEVLRTRSREIYLGRTITDFLRRLDVTITSGKRGTINAYSDHLKRLIHAVFTVEENIEDRAGRRGIHIQKVLFAEEARLWSDAGKGGKGSTILLSEQLYESMLERSAPLALNAIRALRRSPLDLDLYAWLVYRLNHLRRPVTIPWQDLAFQFGQSYQRERDFRQFFQSSLIRVRKVYTAARVEPVGDGLRLAPSVRHIARS